MEGSPFPHYNGASEIFVVNTLNELTGASRTGTVTATGSTSSKASSVTVNGTSANLYADSTWAVPNLSVGTTYTANAQDSGGRQASATVNNVNLPASLTYQYDANGNNVEQRVPPASPSLTCGNLTGDGVRTYAYDDENQLASVTVAGNWMSSFQYDGKMRRRIRKEYTWVSGAWSLQSETHYIYDGNLVLQERNGANAVQVTCTRGKDLSGSLEGAGGIGGLLARTDATSSTGCYHADGNGNITALIDSTQTVVARYLYDAFGNTLAKSGSLADANLYRFSSKELHPNSGLVYYLYRYYDPNLQRWLNRDLLVERGFKRFASSTLDVELPMMKIDIFVGPNLYSFTHNDPENEFDLLGLSAKEPPIPVTPAPVPAPPNVPGGKPTKLCPNLDTLKCLKKDDGFQCLQCCQQNFAKQEIKSFLTGPKNWVQWNLCNALCAGKFPDDIE